MKILIVVIFSIVAIFVLLFLYNTGITYDSSLREVDNIFSEYVLCDFQYSPLILDMSKADDFCTMPYRIEANPIYTVSSITKKPDGSSIYLFASKELLEFSGDGTLLRQIAISDFNLPSGENIFKGQSACSNDTLLFVIQNIEDENKSSSKNSKYFLIRWDTEGNPKSSFVEKEIDIGCRWSVDFCKKQLVIPSSKPITYDLLTHLSVTHNWPAMSYSDYNQSSGLLLSSILTEDIKTIIHIDSLDGKENKLIEGKCAFWGPEGYIYFFRKTNELWRCNISGQNVELFYSAGHGTVIIPHSICISDDKTLIALFYKSSSVRKKHGIVVIDIIGGKFHRYEGIGFGNLVWLHRGDSSNVQKRVEEYVLFVKNRNLPPYSELHDAVFQWPLSSIKWLIDYNLNINEQDNKGNTPLHYAAEVGRTDVVELLLSKGANPNLINMNGDSPLHLAAKGPIYNYCEPFYPMELKGCIISLLRYGADPNIKNKLGQTPETIATEYPGRRYLSALFSPLDKIDSYTALSDAISQNDFERMKILIEKGVDVNVKGKGGKCPLELAWYMGDEYIRLLVKNGADVNQVFQDGFTPLQLAVIQEDENLINLIASHGADINVKTRSGETIVELAKSHISVNSEKIVKLLIKLGAK
jgi:ankyrin repeat protein